MTANPFQAASKEKAKLRLALAGISGAGKTYSALAIGAALAEAEGTKLAVLDTENGSASKYADLFTFDTFTLREPYGYERFIEYIKAAEQYGYGVLIIDSLSAAWEGEGGLLTAHEVATRRMGDSFRAWAEVTPLFKRLMRAILNCKIHVIATLQVTSEYQIEEKQTGKKNMRQIGSKPVMKAGFEYYFDIIGTLDSAELLVSKTRNPALTGRLIARPGAPLATEILDWLNAGVEPREPEPEDESPIQRVAPSRNDPKPALPMKNAAKQEPDSPARAAFAEVAKSKKLGSLAICQALSIPIQPDGSPAEAIDHAAKLLGWEELTAALTAGRQAGAPKEPDTDPARYVPDDAPMTQQQALGLGVAAERPASARGA